METKIKGVKKGTKRGSYKKKIKDETIINKMDNVEITNEATQTTNDSNIDSIQNEPIIKNEISTNDIADGIKSDVSASNNINDEFKQQSERAEFQQTTGEEKLDNFFNEYQQIKEETPNHEFTPQSQTAHNQQMKMLINGYMLLSLCDVVFPYGIKFLFGLFDKRAKKVNASEMKLEPEQRQALMNSADEVAKYVFEKANPMTVFIICLGLFYGSNFNEQLNKIKE